MITLNGKLFAANENEFVDSIFNPNGSCVGYYKRNKTSVTLYNMQKEKIAVINKHAVLCNAQKLDSGKWWYSLADVAEVGSFACYNTKREELKTVLTTDNF